MIQDWLNSNLDKQQLTPDPPNGINGECVNAAGSASMFQGGPQLFGSGDDSTAWTIWQTFTHPKIAKIVNTPTNQPSPGDLVFYAPFNASAGTGAAGHVDVAIDQINLNSFRAADANWNEDRNLQLVPHSYAGVVGWFHIIPDAPSADVDTPNADNEGVVNGAGLRGHSQPDSQSSAPWFFDNNEHITLVAKTQGENITAGPYAPSAWWYLAHGNDANAQNAGSPEVWVSDAYVRTTHTPASVPDYVASASPTNTSLPAKPVVLDISSVGQPNGVDFAAVKAHGVTGVIIRAGHVGASFGGLQPNNTDPKFHEYATAAVAAGLEVGYYWYGFPALDPLAEAQAFVASIGALAEGEPLFLDIEEDGDNVKDWSNKFVAQVEKLTNRACWLYSYTSFIQKYSLGGNSDVAWEANFNEDSTDSSGLITNAVLHQYSDKGVVPGVKDTVDLSVVLKGSLTDLAIDYPAAPPQTVSSNGNKGDTKVPEVSAVQPGVKPGWKTSEFWLNLLVQAGSLLVITQQTAGAGGSVWAKIVAVLGAVLSSIGYSRARATVKAAAGVVASNL